MRRTACTDSAAEPKAPALEPKDTALPSAGTKVHPRRLELTGLCRSACWRESSRQANGARCSRGHRRVAAESAMASRLHQAAEPCRVAAGDGRLKTSGEGGRRLWQGKVWQKRGRGRG
eukprot:5328082-Pleurochrysis_carterae.AAC.1